MTLGGSSSGSRFFAPDWSSTPFRDVVPIGQGGMGAVFRAVDARVGRRVALKLYTGHSREGRARFRREGMLSASLQHPNVVAVHEVLELPQGDLLVCELVEGAESLDAAWRGRGLLERVRLLRDAAAGVGAAHRAGVVHRDLKPDNVLVGSDGRARVADFGIAYSGSLERLTQTGAIVGTPNFMAPEQLDNKHEPSPQTDVWALGVLLYFAMTDDLPFDGESMVELASKIVGGISSSQRSVLSPQPRALRELVEACLQRDPGRRPEDADAVASALQTYLDDPTQGGGRSGPMLGVGLVVTLGLGALWFAFGHEGDREATPPASSASTSPTPSRAPAADPGRGLDHAHPLVRHVAALRLLREAPSDPRAEEATKLLRRQDRTPLLEVEAHAVAGQGLLPDPLALAVVTAGGRYLLWRPDARLVNLELPFRPAQGGRLCFTSAGDFFVHSGRGEPLPGLLRVPLGGPPEWVLTPEASPEVVISAFPLSRERCAVGGVGKLWIQGPAGREAELSLEGEIVQWIGPFRGGLLSLSGSPLKSREPHTRIRAHDLGLTKSELLAEVAGNHAYVAVDADETKLAISNSFYFNLSVLDLETKQQHSVFTAASSQGITSSLRGGSWRASGKRILQFAERSRSGIAARVECWDADPARPGAVLWRLETPGAARCTFAGEGPDFAVVTLPELVRVYALPQERD